MRTSLIFGVGGQVGSYLAEHLLDEGERVVGFFRRTSLPNLGRIDHVGSHPRFSLIKGDVTDFGSVIRAVGVALGESGGGQLSVYNLAAQSHVGDSFGEPCHTTDVTYGGCLKILEALREFGVAETVRFYQASSSEMFGSSYSEGEGEKYQDEKTPFLPNSPYAIAKLAAHHLVRVYRDSYNMFACGGILFNNESPRRSVEFVTRKITRHVARLALGLTNEPLYLGNLEARRDWGHTKDYVRAMRMMLMAKAPADYVVSTGETHSVREFAKEAFKLVGLEMERHVRVHPALLRPCEVPYLRGDSSKIRKELGWEPKVSFKELVREMVEYDLADLDGEPQ